MSSNKTTDEGSTIEMGQASPNANQRAKDSDYLGQLFKERYYIEKELGRGGIGVVYLAQDRQLHSKPVVVKVLLEESLQEPWYKKKFKQEIEALSRLDHPGIVGVFDSGDTPDSKPFLVMQFIKGGALGSMIKPAGLEFDFVAKTVRQIGQALSAAHNAGVLHCDLKPENVMMQDLSEGEYQAKIVDFGIAKVSNSQAVSSSSTKVAGTPFYMSPEQVLGKPCPETDVFALGVIAYELLTGRRPFHIASPYRVLEGLQNGVMVKPLGLRPDLPSEAQRIVLKALELSPENRYARARDFGELLAQALTAEAEMAKPEKVEDVEIAHTLFMDVVGYSKLPTDEQTRLVKQLQNAVTNSETFRQAQKNRQVIYRPTGDGMLLAFFNRPTAPVQCAVEITRELRARSPIGLRMGIHSGTVYRVKDMNDTADVAGAGINIAQRVMDCGDAGHILLSKSVADVLTELGEWRSRIYDLGERRVKHGARLHLYNLHFEEIGNQRLPATISQQRKSLVAALLIGLLILLVASVAVWMIGSGKGSNQSPTSNVNSNGVISPEIDRMLSYSLTVVPHINDGRPARQIPGPEDFSFKDFDVQLNINAAQEAYLYVLNELSSAENSPRSYQVIYPFLSDKSPGKVSRVKIPEDAKQWIPPLGEGTRRLWLIWSDNPVDEIESVKAGAKAAGGKVEDPARNKAIQEVLVKYKTAKDLTQIDDAKKQTEVIWKGKALAYDLTLHY